MCVLKTCINFFLSFESLIISIQNILEPCPTDLLWIHHILGEKWQYESLQTPDCLFLEICGYVFIRRPASDFY